MTTRFLLVRHATCHPVGVSIAGRAPGVSLDVDGRAEAARLADALRAAPIEAIYTSPLERARETADAIARVHHLPVQQCDAFTEIDFGEWTGCTFDALAADERWRRFNTFRSATRIPGGELITEVQLRAVRGLEQLRRAHADGTVVVVSHADVIRAVLAYYLGMPLDLMLRLEIAPASTSVLHLDDWGATIARVNELPGER